MPLQPWKVKLQSFLSWLLFSLLLFSLSGVTMERIGRTKLHITPDSKVHWANMGPTWVLSAQDGPHVGPMNLAISDTTLLVVFRFPAAPYYDGCSLRRPQHIEVNWRMKIFFYFVAGTISAGLDYTKTDVLTISRQSAYVYRYNWQHNVNGYAPISWLFQDMGHAVTKGICGELCP